MWWVITVDDLMSLAVGAVSSSKNMGGFDEENKEGGYHESGDEREEDIKGSGSETSFYATDQEEEDDATIQLGPQYTLKEQLEKDKVFFFSAQISNSNL